MKHFLLLSLIFTAVLHAQTPKDSEKAMANLSSSQREFSNLPEEKRKEFIQLYSDAQRFFASKRVFETLETLNKAEKIFSKSVELLNLKGSCYVEMRIFDKAELVFNEALEISPNNPSVKFNLAECKFVSRQWQESHDKFQELLRLMPVNEIAMSRLIEFKILLCKKKLGLHQEAKILAEKYDHQDDSPYYYYAQAALAYDNKELVKGDEWTARANRIFRDPNILAPWQDTMLEYGYIESFLGGGDETE